MSAPDYRAHTVRPNYHVHHYVAPPELRGKPRALRIVEQHALSMERMVFSNEGDRYEIRRVRHGLPNEKTVS